MAVALVCAGLVVAAVQAAEHAVPLRIVQRKVENAPKALRVTVGDTIELRWTTDEATIVHLHGYDVTLRLDPATEGRMRLEANATGRFPISAHGFGAATGEGKQREVVLLYLEVHPK